MRFYYYEKCKRKGKIKKGNCLKQNCKHFNWFSKYGDKQIDNIKS